VKILVWHRHGSWTTAFGQGGHEYLVPVLPGRGPDGLGRARTYRWPGSVVEAGVCSARLDELTAAVRRFLHDPSAAAAAGAAARSAALDRYGLGRFLADWEMLFKEVTR
jgi:hypothetical protein